jgi:hypothetical protein
MADRARASTVVHTVSDPPSRQELLRMLIRETNRHDFVDGVPPSSGQSVDSQALSDTYAHSFDSFPQQGAAGSGSMRGRRAPNARVASYPAPSVSSGSATVAPIHCKHRPGGIVDPRTFEGCYETENELNSDEPQTRRRAQKRVEQRKQRDEAAAAHGVTTGQLDRMVRERTAANKGYASPREYELKRKDERAAALGYQDRRALQRAQRDEYARKLGFLDYNDRKREQARAGRQSGFLPMGHEPATMPSSTGDVGLSIPHVTRDQPMAPPGNPWDTFAVPQADAGQQHQLLHPDGDVYPGHFWHWGN